MAKRPGSSPKPAGALARVLSRIGGKSPGLGYGQTQPRSAFMRDSASGVLGNFKPAVRDINDDVRSSWTLGAGRAIESIHNSGWLTGGIDQAVTDTVGVGLRLNATPDAVALEMTDVQARDWCRLVEKRWRAYAASPLECDARGKRTVAELSEAAVRYAYGFGEVTVLFPKIRRPRSITETKVLMISPARMPLETDERRRLHQGVWLDDNGMPTGYRFRRSVGGIESWLDVGRHSQHGRTQVAHIFEGLPDQVRGITPLAPILLRARQYDQLSDATITAALIQTIIAATIKSESFGENAFEGFQAGDPAAETAGSMPDEVEGHMQAKLQWWANRSINLGAGARIAHLFPGEELDLHSPTAPHDTYLPFVKNLLLEMARCIGVTYEGLTGDFTGATYSSVRMGVSSIWPMALRRRQRIATPFNHAVYENFLEDEIGAGRIPMKRGLKQFYGARAHIAAAEWHGPAAPTADDYKSARASGERLDRGITSLGYEQAQYGLDPETVAEQRAQDIELYASRGLPNPYEKIAPRQMAPIDPLLEDK